MSIVHFKIQYVFRAMSQKDFLDIEKTLHSKLAFTGILSLLARPYYKYPGLFCDDNTQHKLHCDIITFTEIVWLQSHVTKVFSWRHSCFRLTSLVIVVTRCHYYFFNFFFFLLASSFFFCHISHSDGIMYQKIT